ncbi:hypothetical protein PC119_g25878 [Phytophthora cactorum]|uniref:Uncharacterized protein n=1 Tax=Phytophthora cactorum TaxID=29920 RepID=A0A8T1ANF6_9STRA|nr:hypothetical protein PC114_g21546 [Phytophthora cactorum]KAG2883320.1 hypothetical protein PC117_g26047 [Phytophthora cactorum]KAG2962196.1 hypothetical protein PC119_g25878 [Phytophthora cactorum]KAG3124423.1 hypothetical protein C6341_g26167 [Phytophthora cactorum]
MLEAANDVWRLDPTGGHALISHAGSQDQAVHCNFPAFETVQALLVHVTLRLKLAARYAYFQEKWLHSEEILLMLEHGTAREPFACIVTCWSMGSNKRKIRQKP